DPDQGCWGEGCRGHSVSRRASVSWGAVREGREGPELLQEEAALRSAAGGGQAAEGRGPAVARRVGVPTQSFASNGGAPASGPAAIPQPAPWSPHKAKPLEQSHTHLP
uniref:Uncharacterized protein n=1 Tax=Mustela putorius furo TaxID=9669 RepID=M3YT57_MUSPF